MKETKGADVKPSRLMRRTVVLIGYVGMYALLFWMAAWGCKTAYGFGYEVFGSVAVEEEPGMDVAFQVEAADTIESVSKKLEEENLIVSQYSFRAKVRVLNNSDNILKPGIYMLNTSMDYQEILDQLMVTEGVTE